MRKAFRKAVCLTLVLAFCLSIVSFVTPALADGEPTLDKTELSMLLGGSLETLTVTGVPEGTAITWASDDLRVARVSNGKVISVSEGTANVTAEVGGKTLTCVVTVHRDDLLIANDVFILDTDGNPIYAHEYCIYKYKEGEPYYWYGVSAGSNINYYNSLKTGNGTPGGSGTSYVKCYSSYNLVDWEFVGDVMTPGQNGWPSGIGRMGVVYCAATDTYVLANQGSGGVRIGDSKTPEGPFTYRRTLALNQLLPDPCITTGPGDMTMYYDNNTGKAYIVYCSDGVDIGGSQDLWHTLAERGVCYVAELDENDGFLSIKANYEFYDTKKDTYYNLRREGGREANCIFYYDGWYYNAASGLAGWNVSPTFYMGGAKTPIDAYTNEVGLPNNMTPMRGSNSNFSHSSQVVGFVTIDTPVTEQTPKGQLVLEYGDRWTDKIGNHTGGHGIGYYAFSPLSFLDPQTAPPSTKEEEPKTPNPLQYKVNPDGTPNVDYYPWGDMESFYPFIPEGYPYDEWQRPEWDIPVYNSMSQFYFDIENGTWETGPNNNYLDNPEFEQDRIDKCVDMTQAFGMAVNFPVVQDYINEPNGWKAEHIAGQTAQINYGGNRNSNVRDREWQLIAPGTTTQNWYSSWAGNYTWYHGYTKRNVGTDPYKTRTYQSVNVPDGRYNFYGWVRSSGGQNEAYVYAGDHKVDISDSIDDWTLVTIEDFLVTGGQIEVGFYSDAADADQWAFFDDFALIAAPVAKSELAALVAEAQELNSTNFAPDGWAQLGAALNGANEVLAYDSARQTWVNAAWAKLYLAVNNLSDTVLASIRADQSNLVINTPASYTVSLSNAKGTGIVTLRFTTDGRYLNLTDAVPQNGFAVLTPLTWEYVYGGVWEGTIQLMCPGFVQTDDPLDILKISGVARDLLGDTMVALTGFSATGDVDGFSRAMPCLIKTAGAPTSIVPRAPVYSKYDLNQDGSIDELDLAIVVYYYLANDLEPDWDVVKFDIASAKDCDVARNGIVDLADMIEIIANYRDSYNLFP